MKKKILTIAMIIGLVVMNIMPVTAAEIEPRYSPTSITCIYCQKAKVYRTNDGGVCGTCDDLCWDVICPECGITAIVCRNGHWVRK